MATPAPDEVYRGVTRAFGVIVAALGTTIIVVTFANGGGPFSFGVLIGLLFLGMGIGRLYLSLRARS
jgi:hypothetical protein